MIVINCNADRWQLFTTDYSDGEERSTRRQAEAYANRMNKQLSKLLNAARDRTDAGEDPTTVGCEVLDQFQKWIRETGGSQLGALDTEPRWCAMDQIDKYLGTNL